MTAAMIEVYNVAKGFHSRPAAVSMMWHRPAATTPVLRDVSLTVEEGDFVALLGANGVGKTTLMKMIGTLLLPDSGSIYVLDHDAVREERAVRADVGYVMADERSFHWRLDARQNLDFFARLDGIRASERAARIDYLLRRLDLASATRRPFGQFSTGMKQRLAVARALLKRPRVLLMDEPTRSIDPAHAAESLAPRTRRGERGLRVSVDGDPPDSGGPHAVQSGRDPRGRAGRPRYHSGRNGAIRLRSRRVHGVRARAARRPDRPVAAHPWNPRRSRCFADGR